MVFRGLPRACWEFYGKRSFSVTTPCASPTRVDTERLAERETLLHRLGSKLNRTVLNSCGNSLSVAQKHVTFAQPGFFANRVIFTKLTIFGNTKQVIQDYDTVFDNSIPFRKNDPLRITYFRIPGVPGLHFVPWHRGSGCLGAAAPVTGAAADEHNLNVVDCDASVTVPRLSFIQVLKWGSGGYRDPQRVCLLRQDLLQSCARGGGGEWRTCAMRYDEPRLVWTRLTTTH